MTGYLNRSLIACVADASADDIAAYVVSVMRRSAGRGVVVAITRSGNVYASGRDSSAIDALLQREPDALVGVYMRRGVTAADVADDIRARIDEIDARRDAA